jgi:hypothetical protein
MHKLLKALKLAGSLKQNYFWPLIVQGMVYEITGKQSRYLLPNLSHWNKGAHHLQLPLWGTAWLSQ